MRATIEAIASAMHPPESPFRPWLIGEDEDRGCVGPDPFFYYMWQQCYPPERVLLLTVSPSSRRAPVVYVQESTPVRRKRTGLWLFLILLLTFGLAASHLTKQGIDWQQKFAELQEWLFERAPVNKPETPSLPSIVPPSFDIASVDDTGKLVVAGRAESGWTVRLGSKTLR